jgi:hypothetical protein
MRRVKAEPMSLSVPGAPSRENGLASFILDTGVSAGVGAAGALSKTASSAAAEAAANKEKRMM